MLFLTGRAGTGKEVDLMGQQNPRGGRSISKKGANECSPAVQSFRENGARQNTRLQARRHLCRREYEGRAEREGSRRRKRVPPVIVEGTGERGE